MGLGIGFAPARRWIGPRARRWVVEDGRLMLLDDLFARGSLPVLERVVEFTEQRQKVLAHNIANIDTPFYRTRDLDVQGFQRMLAEAVERRRGGLRRPTIFRGASTIRIDDAGHLHAKALAVAGSNVLFHDRNNRNAEKLMADLAQNEILHNVAFRLLRNQMQLLQTAIRGRL